MFHNGGHCHRSPRLHVAGNVAEVRERFLADFLDVHIKEAAAREAYGEGVVVRDSVALEYRVSADRDRLGELVDGAFDAASGHRTDGRPAGADEHRGSRRSRRGPEGGDDRRDADDLAGLPPVEEFGQHFTHGPRPY